jgi:putative hemolysin
MKIDIDGLVGDRVIARAQQHGNYTLSLARTQEDIRAAQGLRFLVFNLEMNEGLEHSYATLLDADPFDAVCDHLLVRCGDTGEVVGTYRMQTGQRAKEALGYYSAQEFCFDAYESIRSEIVELGRACVHKDHRNLAVLSLLWRGIYLYAAKKGCRYLIGCSSISSTEATVGASAYAQLCRRHLVEAKFRTHPTAVFECPMEHLAATAPKIPKLLSAYLSLGAKICGAPAIDREFKTIDFLTLMDMQGLPEKSVKRLLSGGGEL